MAKRKLSSVEWGEAYQAERPTHLSFTRALEALLRQLLDQAAIPYAQIESRTKDIPNFVSKLRRKHEKYDNPLSEVTDLVGLRIVLFYLDDVERVSELIEQQFAIDAKHSADKSAALDPDRFGYLSVHHVVRLTSSRNDLLEWKHFDGLCAEIQVRTVLQHAWAAISRKLAYASVHEAPRDLQRNLNRLSALLELADDEFLEIRTAREEIEVSYDREVERGNLDLEVDESSLDIYLRETGVRDRIRQLAQEAGSPNTETLVEGITEDELNEITRDLFKRLLQTIEHAGLKRIADVDVLLDGLWESFPDFVRVVNERCAEGPLPDAPDNWLSLIILWSIRAPSETFADVGYVGGVADVVLSMHEPA